MLSCQSPVVFLLLLKPSRLAASILQPVEAQESEDKQADESHQEQEWAANFTPEQRKELLEDLHNHMDTHLHAHDDEWDRLLQKKNSEGYLRMFARCIEDATAQFGELCSNGKWAIRGRGAVNVQTTKEPRAACVSKHNDDLEPVLSPYMVKISKQIRRLEAIQSCVIKAGKQLEESCETKNAREVEIQRSANAFIPNHMHAEPGYECDQYLKHNHAQILHCCQAHQGAAAKP